MVLRLCSDYVSLACCILSSIQLELGPLHLCPPVDIQISWHARSCIHVGSCPRPVTVIKGPYTFSPIYPKTTIILVEQSWIIWFGDGCSWSWEWFGTMMSYSRRRWGPKCLSSLTLVPCFVIFLWYDLWCMLQRGGRGQHTCAFQFVHVLLWIRNNFSIVGWEAFKGWKGET